MADLAVVEAQVAAELEAMVEAMVVAALEAVVEAQVAAELALVVKAQVAAIDNILLNAYGTVYKMAVKYFPFENNSYELSQTEEMLSAKNVVSNLWSVLDYCCMTLHYKYNGIPTRLKARRIQFPCYHEGLPNSSEKDEENKLKKWENQIKHIVEKKTFERRKIAKFNYDQFKSMFDEVLFKKEPVDQDIIAFYQLHFLRNILTHQSITITPNGTDEHHRPQIYQHHELDIGAQAAITVGVPKKPWKTDADDSNDEREEAPIIDVLYQACKVVEGLRDKLLNVIGEKKFSDKFEFSLKQKHLEVKIAKEAHEIRHSHLHLECYGMEMELKQELKKLRKPYD